MPHPKLDDLSEVREYSVFDKNVCNMENIHVKEQTIGPLTSLNISLPDHEATKFPQTSSQLYCVSRSVVVN